MEAEDHLRRIAYEAARDELDARGLLGAEPEPLFDVRGLAQYLNVSKRTVEALIASGELVPIRIRTARRFSKQAVDRFLRGQAGRTRRRRQRRP